MNEHLIDTHGEVIEKATKLQQLQKKAALSKCRWIFMSKCAKHDLFPKGFRTKPYLRTKEGYQIAKEYNKRMLIATKDDMMEQYHKYLNKIKELKEQLEQLVSSEDLMMVENIAEKSRENNYKKETKRLKEKFEKLVQKEISRDEVYSEDGVSDE